MLIPSGTWRTGTIRLASNVELHLAHGSRLLASHDPTDYREVAISGEYGGSTGAFLIEAEGANNVAITGTGMIDGQSLAFMDGFQDDEGRFIRKPKAWRPRGIGLKSCSGVRLLHFTIRDAAQWTVHLTGCEDVLIDGLTIRNRTDVPNNDGIDPDHCRHVRITNCHLEAGDDGIVIKNTKGSEHFGPTENILIANCSIVSTSAAIKIGTESVDDFRNIVVSSCILDRSNRGIAVQLRDGGKLAGLHVSDCLIRTRRFHGKWWGQGEPIYLTALPRHEGITPGGIRDVQIRGVACHGENGVVVMGTESVPVQNLRLDDVSIILEQTSRWPGGKLDRRPLGGEEHGGLEEASNPVLYGEHVRGFSLRGCTAAWRGAPQSFWGPKLKTRDATPDICDITGPDEPPRP